MLSPFVPILVMALLFPRPALADPPGGDRGDGHQHAAPKVRTPPGNLRGDEAKHVALYLEVLSAVVTILTTSHVAEETGFTEREALGSGVLISARGHVLTAAHLVEQAEAIVLKTSSGDVHRARLVYSEAGADIALLQITPPVEGLPHAVLGDSDRLAVGQTAYVIGSPHGLENSFSVGHVSGFREMDRLYDGTIAADFIQVDAAINSGNSGGPVFDSSGRVIGIASWILTKSGGFEGVGFVVAINTAKKLLALEDRTWMGIEAIFMDARMLTSLLNLDLEGGLLVQRVIKDSPADRAGLKGGTIPARILGQEILLGGDLILEFNTQEACHSRCLIEERGRLSGLDFIPVKVLRKGREQTLTIDVRETRINFLEGLGAP